MSDAEVVILQVHVEIGVDQPVLDELPNDPCHLIAVDLDDRAFDLDLRHAANLSNDQVALRPAQTASGGRYTRSTRS